MSGTRGAPALPLLALVATLLGAAGPSSAAAPEPSSAALVAPSPQTRAQTILNMLDYVAVDYPDAVKDGQVLDQSEFKEQRDFVTQAIVMLGELPDRSERGVLVQQARRLLSLVEARGPGEDVARLAGEIRWALIKAYQVPVAPARPPDLRAARELYAARCATCHGAEGHGDGPAARGLEPRPSDFHDRERFDRRSAYALYSTITLGVPRTAMAAFADLSDEQRWGLALHVASLADAPAAPQRGAALWNGGRGRSDFADLAALATTTAAEVKARQGEDGLALLAYLRTRPDVLVRTGGDALARSARLLGESLEAYRAGRAREAQDLAVASYLDGFEPVEPSLDALDRALRVRVESEMIRYRALLRDGAPLADVQAQAERVQGLLADTQRVLSDSNLAAGPAFVSAFVILLREGLEAVLVVAAIIALLVRAGRRDALPAVHGGWIAALALGALTWIAASYVVTISGATREVTEGITALVATAVLLYVGFWMHDKSHARRWDAYLRGRLRGALGRGATWGLASVTFLAVYREVFETVLFYQALWLQTAPGGQHALVAGLGVAAVALVLSSWLIIRGSLHLPLGVFFGATSLVLAALAIVLAGKGIAALQEAAVLAPRPIGGPRWPLLGVYPDLVGVVLQVALALLVVTAFTWRSRALRRAS
jgi:high-affinity iron transporter